MEGSDDQHVGVAAEFLSAAREAELSDMEALNVVRVWDGHDEAGRKVVVLTRACLPQGDEARERALQLFARDMNEVSKQPYRVICVNSGRAIGLGDVIWFSRRARAVLPARFWRNFDVCTVVHPGLFCRLLVYAIRPFISSESWEKLQLCDRISELVLDGSFVREDLPSLLPNICSQFELVLEAEADTVREQSAQLGEFSTLDRVGHD
jgi:Divergent CRAL/TRIO domain